VNVIILLRQVIFCPVLMYLSVKKMRAGLTYDERRLGSRRSSLLEKWVQSARRGIYEEARTRCNAGRP